jgi:thiol-disulfide isomerase/thioredoxin
MVSQNFKKKIIKSSSMSMMKRNILIIVILSVGAFILFILVSFILEKSSLKEKSGYSDHGTKVTSKQFTNQKKKNIISKSKSENSEFDSIYVMDQEKLEILLALKIPLILAYFSPWCGHCKHFIPLFIEFANDYRLHHSSHGNSHGDHDTSYIGTPNRANSSSYTNNNGSKNKEEINIEKLFSYNVKQNNFIFGTIDCTAEKKLCEKIDRTPTVLAQYYKKGMS